MPVSRSQLSGFLRRRAAAIFLLVLFCLGPRAEAITESSPLHWSGDQTSWDRRTNKVTLEGHAQVSQPGESLTADHILLDLENRTIDARGNCNYFTPDSVMQGEEMYFNLDTRTGTIVGGRVSSERFTLTGERINKLGVKRFQTHRGEYSTCRDCPQSWALRGDDVDLEFEGYAYMSNVTAKVKDAPLFWLPYLVVPVKTIRQSGFLFPRFGPSSEGFRFVIPFYWAINRSSDLTVAVGEYGGRGFRFEGEGRYKLSERSEGTANLNYLYDQSFLQAPNRWSLNLAQIQELPGGVDQKLRILEVSDNNYPATFGDVPGVNEAFIASDLIFSHSTSQVSTSIAARRYRNLIFLEENGVTKFDPNTVQTYPTISVATNDKVLSSDAHLTGGLSLGLTNFTRAADAFDANPAPRPAGSVFPTPGFDPIRKAERLSVTPSLYTSLRPWDVVSVVPSAEYRAFVYSFNGLSGVPNLARGYGLLRTDISTQWERIYETSDPEIPKTKHLIRPILSYSLIPFVNTDDNHPFLQQINYARNNGISGFNFDNSDIVPFEGSRNYANYYIPQGNSLSYGFTTQYIRRKGKIDDPNPSYQRSVELRAGQTYDFRELTRDSATDGRRPFSRFFSFLGFEFDRYSAGVDYVYVPYLPANEDQSHHIVAASGTFVLERSVHQGILAFDRSISLGYAYSRLENTAYTNNLRSTFAYSLSDYILPSIYLSYDLVSKRYQAAGAALRFQSPSRCWRIDISASGNICPEQNGFCIQKPTFDLSLNLTGEGFGGVTGVAQSAQAR